MCNNHSKYYHHRNKFRSGKFRPNDHFGNWARGYYSDGGSTYPKANVIEEVDRYEIQFKVPGFEKEDFKVSIDGEILSVSAEGKKFENKDQIKRAEFSTRGFKRQFQLNEKILKDGIKAEYKNGILKLTLNKKEEFHAESINIEID